MYVHIPFCHSKCAYCDFYSGPLSWSHDEYIEAIIKESALRRNEIDAPFDTVYIGGGTPSIIRPELLKKIVSGLKKVLSIDSIREFTVEVNPEDVTAELLDAYLGIGVNRISMGVQSLNDNELKIIGRRHSATQAVDAIEIIKSRFSNYSCDLIFGLPEQTTDSLRQNLQRFLSLDIPHISAYLLSYEPGTRLDAMLRAGKVAEASESLAHEMYALIHDTLTEAGYHHYEISNYAMPGREAIHNSRYWDGTPYLGLGAAAHSFDGTVRRFNPSNIKQYCSAINSGNCSYIIDEEDRRQQFNDFLITALRTDRGLDISEAISRWGSGLVSELRSNAAPLLRRGAIILAGDRLIIPHSLWLLSDTIMRDLII